MTSGRETTLGGSGRDFPSTCWSRFMGRPHPAPESRAETLETLAKSYWKPIYAYIRARFGKPVEDAKDLTQDFFIWMMETDFLDRPDPAKGRFRAFVKGSLHNYFLNTERDGRTQKRGGGRRFVPIDAAEVPVEGGRSPEDALDDIWRGELIGRAADRLEEECRREAREVRFLLFRDFYLRGGEPPSYRDAAAAHGLTESLVTNYLYDARQRFRDIVTDLVAETVDGAADLQEELRSLFGEGWK